MHGWTYASYNLLLAGTFTWVSDVYVVIMVADQMLQAFLLKRCAGYLAYGRTERSDKAADWLAARAEAQAETTDSRCGGCLCCCGPRPDVLVEHEAQREARIAAHRGVLPGLEPDAAEA